MAGRKGISIGSFRGAQMRAASSPPPSAAIWPPCSQCSPSQGLQTREQHSARTPAGHPACLPVTPLGEWPDPARGMAPAPGKAAEPLKAPMRDPGCLALRLLSHMTSSFMLAMGVSPGSIPDGKALIFKTPEMLCAYPLSLTRALPLFFHQT